jgi:general secretion pathway protein L
MPTWLGIDIGSAHVKAALVRSAYRKTALVRLGSADVAQSPSLVEAVRVAVTRAIEGEPGPDAVAASLEGSRAAIHRLLLPGTAMKQIDEVLPYELAAQVPFDLDESVFDWRILDQPRDDGQLPIVAAVGRLEEVRARIELVKEATGYEPERIAVGALALGALVPAIPSLGEAGTVAIVDLGAKGIEVLVLERGETVFARTLSTGTEGLPGSAPRLAREIRLSFAAHRAAGGAPPERVVLCGGGAFVSGAEGFLSGELEMPVQLLPEPALDTSALGEQARELPRYAKAVALALSLGGRAPGMNLRRGPLTFERGFAWVRDRLPVLAGLAAVVLVSFVFSGWARLYEVHAERGALQRALGAVTKEVLGSEADTAQEAQDLLAKEAALTEQDPMPHADAFDVMVRLSEAVPTTVTHDVEELDVQNGHVTVRGVAGSIPEAQSIATALGENKCMNDVKIKSTTQAVGGDRQKYLMEFQLKCPEDAKAASKKKGDSSAAAGSGEPGGK